MDTQRLGLDQDAVSSASLFPSWTQEVGLGGVKVQCLGRWFKLFEILGRMCVNDKEGVS